LPNIPQTRSPKEKVKKETKIVSTLVLPTTPLLPEGEEGIDEKAKKWLSLGDAALKDQKPKAA
jgi:hypothetical protein